MNKRIEELAEQSLREVTANGFSDETYRAAGFQASVSKAFADKFAESIIKECISAVMENYHSRGTTVAVISIENRFGVEDE